MMIKILLERLQDLSKAAPQGAHLDICKTLGLSTSYSKKIRAGSSATIDSYGNQKLIRSMILEYEKVISNKIDELIEIVGYDE